MRPAFNIYGKTLLAIAMLAVITISACPLPVISQSIPCTVVGHVTFGGSAASGAHVTLSDGQSKNADGSGFYQFTVNNGSSYTVTATYNGHSASRGFTATGALIHADLTISTSGPSPSPTSGPVSQATATPVQTATPMPDYGIIGFAGTDTSIEGDGPVSVTVVRSGGAHGSVSIDYKTVDGTAIAGTNYLPASGTLHFTDGETSKTITLTVLKADDSGKNLTFKTILHDPAGGASLGGHDTLTTTIARGHANGVFSVGDVLYNVTSAGTVLSVDIVRREGSKGNVTVEYYTVDGSAVAGKNYVPVSGVLAFGDGETSKHISVTILESVLAGDRATFKIALKDPTGGASIGKVSSADIIINQAEDASSSLVSIVNRAGGIVTSGNPGSGGHTFTSINELSQKAARTLEALVLGATISFVALFWSQIWELLLRLLGPFREIVLGYGEELLFHYHKRTRKVTAVARKPLLWGVSSAEIVTLLISMVLLGLAFSYAEEHEVNLQIFILVGLVAGFSIVLIQMASHVFARRNGMVSEYKFWDVGALSLIITSIFLSIPFARPAMVVITEEVEEKESVHHEKKEHAHKNESLIEAIIAISSPYTGLVLSIAFLLFILYGGLLGEIGISGIKISALLSSYTLLPLKPMEGRNVYRWNKLVWAMMFIPSVILYFMVGILLE